MTSQNSAHQPSSILDSLKQSTSIVSAGLVVFLMLILALVFFQNKLEATSHQQFRSVMLALELKESSAKLTNFARSYVITHNELYKKRYWDIVNMRQGLVASEVLDDNRLHQLATAGLLPERGDLVSSQEWFEYFQLKPNELALIAEAERLSMTLVTLEEKAMDLTAQGKLPDVSEGTLPIDLLFSALYMDELQKIQNNIDQFIAAVNQRTDTEKMLYQYWVWAMSGILLLQILVFSSYILLYSNRLLRTRLMMPIAQLLAFTQALAQGKKSNEPLELVDFEMRELYDGLVQIQLAQQKMDEYNHFNQQMMAALPFGLLLINKEGCIEFANPAAKSLLEVANVDLLNHSIARFLPELTDLSDFSVLKMPAQTSQERRFMAEVSCCSVSQNQQQSYLMVLSDIDDRARAEQRLRFIEFVVDKSPDIVFWVNPKSGLISYADETAYEVLGYENGQLLNLPIIEMDSSLDNLQGMIMRLADEVIIHKETHFSCADGSKVPVDVSYFFADFGGRQTLILSARDIRERLSLQDLMHKQMLSLQDGRRATTNMLLDLEQAKKEVERIHRHTRESIEYASLIQKALIPEDDLFQTMFSDYFCLWQPKDLVGGDIYFFTQLRHEDECLLMVIDCTGHGVPGAFVTMLVKAVEQQIVASVKHLQGEVHPKDVLALFNQTLKRLLKQETIDSISNAGFDGAILYYDRQRKLLRFAGAETALHVWQDNAMQEIKGNRHSIGYKKSDANYEFTEHEISVSKGMKFYVTTDGYLDQNGGAKGFPFSRKRYLQTLNDSMHLTMMAQKQHLLTVLDDYQGDEIRNDDVTVIGFTI
ncbi:SpoIIE family protein phosphatase [Thiosulfativibrio zosterae]|uniref:PAS domain-containing protein n=1 Tax=Thiosulfativibrio zosterae TaxID=2675053 RepID=A0A6F8PQY9_9GAMM|nr:SpoIIE family protein phosphatase [Thiosulfativibrio zosterae]BBP44454.1 hypothetical protein THMIRHAT_22000 [Thiosulfativibrio zosterae]